MPASKLVRDKIPDIIAASGKQANTRVLDDEEYQAALEDKLKEEVAEYLQDNNTEELADILEVVYALAELLQTQPQKLEEIRLKKREERGGFDKKLLLIRDES